MSCFSPRVLNGKRFNFLYKCSSLSTSACTADYHSDDSFVNLGTYAELHHRMKMQAKLGDLVKVYETLMLMKDISGKPTVSDYNAMINCYFTSPNLSVGSVFEVLDWMERYGPVPNAETYTNVLSGLKSVGCLEDGIWVAQRMVDSNFVPSYSVLTELFKKLVKSRNLEGSGVALRLILALGYPPDSKQVGVFIGDLCKAGLVKVAFEVIAAVSQIQNFAKAYHFNPILRSLCKYRKMTIVLSFIGWLKKKGLTLDVHSYTALVNGFGKEKLWGQVTHCLIEMKRANCKLSVVTYTVIIKSLCDDGEVDEALKIFQEMESVGCHPDLVLFNILLRELSCQGRFAETNNLLRVMEQKGLQPDSYTVAGIAGGMLKVGKIKRVYAFLQDIISKGFYLDNVVYNIYLHSISLLNGSKEALAMVPKVMETGFSPTNVSYNTILKGLLTEYDIDKSCRLCHHIKPANGPDLISFNIMLSAACKHGYPAMIGRILLRMECDGIKADVISMTCLIQYYSRIRKIRQCFQLLKFMLENGCHPNTVTLNTLLIELCKNRLLRTAKGIFGYFKTIGISPNTATYNILLRSAIREHNVSLVHELLRDMYGQKVKHDSRTYGCFLYSHCRRGKVSLALQFLDHMLESGMLPDTFMYTVIDGCEPNEGTFHLLNQAYKTSSCLKEFPAVVNELELAFFNTEKWNTKRVGE